MLFYTYLSLGTTKILAHRRIFYSVFLIFLELIQFIPTILLSIIMSFDYTGNMTNNGLFKIVYDGNFFNCL